MERLEQATFIENLLNNIKDDMLEKVALHRVPLEWGEAELTRWFLFKSNEINLATPKLRGSSKKSFEEIRVMRNL